MKIGIIGLGWYGTELAKALSPKHDIRGTKSTREGVEEYSNFPFKTFYLDLNLEPDYENLKLVFDVDALVINIPPPRKAQDGVELYLEQMKKVANCIKRFNAIKKLIFISSTGVFGESQLEVDEDTRPVPTRESGIILKAAEEYFQSAFENVIQIIRPGGLVGKERHPAKYLAGRTKMSGKDHPVNLIHLDDLVALTQILLESENPRRIFHAVSSDHPSRKEYYRFAADKLGLGIPEFDDADSSKGKLVLGEKTEAACAILFRSPFEMV